MKFKTLRDSHCRYLIGVSHHLLCTSKNTAAARRQTLRSLSNEQGRCLSIRGADFRAFKYYVAILFFEMFRVIEYDERNDRANAMRYQPTAVFSGLAACIQPIAMLQETSCHAVRSPLTLPNGLTPFGAVV